MDKELKRWLERKTLLQCSSWQVCLGGGGGGREDREGEGGGRNPRVRGVQI